MGRGNVTAKDGIFFKGQGIMEPDFRYECALAAALVIREISDRAPDAPKHEVLAKTIFTILHAMERYEEERGKMRVEFSAN